MKLILKIALVVLSVIALVLGYMVYKKETKGFKNAPISIDSVAGAANAADGDIFAFPKAGATKTERAAFYHVVDRAAVPTEKIDIAGCVAKPLASSVVADSKITFVNNASVAHTVTFNPQLSFKVPAKSTLVTKASFGKGQGIYGFGCDDMGRAVGVILVK
ncbi:MAG TPA: hypothetical protein VGE35_00430 [Candidatus Paceibacterota bacterium]